jgi:hypothetical protein
LRRGAPGAAGISRPLQGVLAHAWALLTGPPGTIGTSMPTSMTLVRCPPCPGWRREHARSPASCSSLVMNSRISLFIYPM